MSLVAEGHGFTVTHGALSIAQSPITVGIPGWVRAELERTTQGNTAVHTGGVATLRKYEAFKHTFPFDPTDYQTFAGDSTNRLHSVAFPESIGTFAIYAKVLSVSEPNFETDGRPTYDVTFKPTCLDGDGAEAVPTFTAGS